MPEPDKSFNATVALRRPDGHPLDAADAEGLLPTTLLVIEVEARTATDLAAGEPVITLGRVIGWIPPAQAGFGKMMLTGACQAVHQASAALLPVPAGKHHGGTLREQGNGDGA